MWEINGVVLIGLVLWLLQQVCRLALRRECKHIKKNWKAIVEQCYWVLVEQCYRVLWLHLDASIRALVVIARFYKYLLVQNTMVKTACNKLYPVFLWNSFNYIIRWVVIILIFKTSIHPIWWWNLGIQVTLKDEVLFAWL